MAYLYDSRAAVPPAELAETLGYGQQDPPESEPAGTEEKDTGVPPIPEDITAVPEGQDPNADDANERFTKAVLTVGPIANAGLLIPMMRWMLVMHGAEPEDFTANRPTAATGIQETPAAMDVQQQDLPESETPDGDGADLSLLESDEIDDMDGRERYDTASQLGARVKANEAYYPNLVAFVELYVAHMFPYVQSAVQKIQWTPDWWRYPPLVGALDAMWRAYEAARKQPGQMMIFEIQAFGLIDRVFDKNTGIIASLGIDEKTCVTSPNSPLPCIRPPRHWRLATMAPIRSSREQPENDNIERMAR